MLTKRTYYEDMYQKEFEATVIEITGNKVVLSNTCFFPEGGGQVGDTGDINGMKVINTLKEGALIVRVGDQEIPTGGKIIHLLEAPPLFSVGDIVQGKIDWQRRYKIMRLHSASHIMEYFLFQVFGELPRIGACVDNQKDRSDYQSNEKFDQERLSRVEKRINEFIAANHPIKVFPSNENENVRVWESDCITMFCGGTHVRNTSEIGSVKLKRNNRGAGRERVETYLDSE